MPTLINSSDQTITQNNVQTGGANNLLNNVAPPGTSGVPLISNGLASQPSFGTAVVAGGGTGANTLTGVLVGNGTSAITGNAITQHSVLVGGTSNAISSVSVGTTGQILTANTGADPTWQSPAASFAPNSTINIFDDFIGATNTTTGFINSYMSWATALAAAGPLLPSNAIDNGHAGLLISPSAGAGQASVFIFAGSLSGGSLIQSIILGGGAITLNWVFKIVNLSDGTNTYTLRMGLGDTSGAAQANGCYVEYTNAVNSGNWQFVTASASSRTTSNSSVAVTTAYHNVQITINAAASSVSFSVDGVSLGTAISTNIPTAAITPFFNMTRSAGTIPAGALLVDLFYATQTLTTPR